MTAALVAVTALCAVVAGTATAARPPVTVGTPITAAQSGGALNGAFDITRFTQNAAGRLVAHGTFTGTYTDANGVTQQITSAARAVVSNAAAGRCEIANLVLGPLHLNLLGLNVDLNQVHLNISATPGPGNLLGNLLCSVTHLLDNGGGVQALLDRLNSLLGGL
jgi:hypothetical protein